MSKPSIALANLIAVIDVLLLEYQKNIETLNKQKAELLKSVEVERPREIHEW